MSQAKNEQLKNNEIEVTNADFDVSVEYKCLCKRAHKAGAVVMFVGLVRDFYAEQSNIESDIDSIEYLELQHYAGMTETMCQQIVDNAREKFSIDALRLVHRVGKLTANEQIVFVGVASRHRDSAYRASQYIMDYLKTNAPIWKKEVGCRGAQWVGMKQVDKIAVERWN